jgi:uncharacterized lipoprotein YmbA
MNATKDGNQSAITDREAGDLLRNDAVDGATRDTWRLEVMAGPNEGAVVMLAPGTYRLGSGSSSDIVLADNTIDSEHLEFDIAQAGARVTALVAGGRCQQRSLIPGRTQHMRGDGEIVIGETRLRLHSPSVPERNIQRCVIPAYAAIGAAGLLSATFAFMGLTPSSPAHAAREAGQSRAATPTALVASAAFADRLHTLGLQSEITTRASDGTVLATGAILGSEQTQWTQAQSWFDGRYGGRVTLVSHVGRAASSAEPMLDIAAVSMLPVPCVITREGDRYTEGAVIAGTWTIAHIAGDSVTLRQGTREMKVTL